MNIYIKNKHDSLFYRYFSAFIAFTFAFTLIVPHGYTQMVPAQTATVLNLPIPGTMVSPTNSYLPTLIKGITIHPDNALKFDFIIDKGDALLEGDKFKKESTTLIKYFLAALTTPEEEMWVNLSPYEKDRIIPDTFGDTEMGRDLLAQDYLLKQLMSSLMYPEDELGSEFWERVYTKAMEQFGTTEIPMNTFNKVWIVPEKATVYEHENSAFIMDSHLKVMLEEDFVALSNQKDIAESHNPRDVAMENNSVDADSKPPHLETENPIATEIIREILIPEIEREVNQGETFAQLRQIYNSMILATWYKINLEDSLLGQVYVDKNKTKGVDTKDKQINQKIYDQYVESFKKGVYNYIREDYNSTMQSIIPRKYFSGGIAASPINSQYKSLRNLINAALLTTLLTYPALAAAFTEGTSENNPVTATVVINEVQADGSTINFSPSKKLTESPSSPLKISILDLVEQFGFGKNLHKNFDKLAAKLNEELGVFLYRTEPIEADIESTVTLAKVEITGDDHLLMHITYAEDQADKFIVDDFWTAIDIYEDFPEVEGDDVEVSSPLDRTLQSVATERQEFIGEALWRLISENEDSDLILKPISLRAARRVVLAAGLVVDDNQIRKALESESFDPLPSIWPWLRSYSPVRNIKRSEYDFMPNHTITGIANRFNLTVSIVYPEAELMEVQLSDSHTGVANNFTLDRLTNFDTYDEARKNGAFLKARDILTIIIFAVVKDDFTASDDQLRFVVDEIKNDMIISISSPVLRDAMDDFMKFVKVRIPGIFMNSSIDLYDMQSLKDLDEIVTEIDRLHRASKKGSVARSYVQSLLHAGVEPTEENILRQILEDFDYFFAYTESFEQEYLRNLPATVDRFMGDTSPILVKDAMPAQAIPNYSPALMKFVDDAIQLQQEVQRRLTQIETGTVPEHVKRPRGFSSAGIIDQNERDQGRSSSPSSQVSSSPARHGGIDLNLKHLDLQIKRDGKGVPLPVFQQPLETMNIQGFIPIIIKVTPITNVPALLGMADESDEPNDLSYNPLQPMDKRENT